MIVEHLHWTETNLQCQCCTVYFLPCMLAQIFIPIMMAAVLTSITLIYDVIYKFEICFLFIVGLKCTVGRQSEMVLSECYCMQVWDDELERTATHWAEQCQWDHGPQDLLKSIGQNLAVHYGRYKIKCWELYNILTTEKTSK